MRATLSQLAPERQHQISTAAMELFKSRGFHKTTVRDIAAAANMQVGTVYLYIKSKDDVLYLACKNMLAEYSSFMAVVPESSSVAETIILAFLQFLGLIDRYRSDLKVVYRESASLTSDRQQDLFDTERAVQGYFSKMLDDGIKRTAIAECDTASIALNIVMMGHSWSIKGWAIKDIMNFEQYARVQVRNIIRMIPFSSASLDTDTMIRRYCDEVDNRSRAK